MHGADEKNKLFQPPAVNQPCRTCGYDVRPQASSRRLPGLRKRLKTLTAHTAVTTP